MTETTISAPAPTTTDEEVAALRKRADRGLALYEARGDEIRKTSASTYLVPGSDSRGGYVVNYSRERCECRDYEHSGLGVCKHLFAIGALRAARRRSAAEHLASLEDQARNEDMDPDERRELLDRIRRGRRFISPVGA
jgi:hypothetical protein